MRAAGGAFQSRIRSVAAAAGLLLGLCACGGRGAPVSDAPPSAKRPAPAAVKASANRSPSPPAPTLEPAPIAPKTEGALDFVFSVPAQDALLAAGRVITIDPDFKSLSAYSAADGRWQWKTETDSGRGGRHTLAIRRGSVVFWAGNQIYRVDPATGAISPPMEAPWNDNCSWVEEGSACAYHCECHIALADCATGKRIGQNYSMSSIEFHDMDGEHSSSCNRWGVGLVTGAGRVAVVSVEDHSPKSKSIGRFRPATVVLGLDAATGKEIWRSSDLVITGGYHRAGASPDGRTCWGSSREGELRVFECSSGKVLWQKAGRQAPSGGRVFVSHVPERRGLFRFQESAAEVFDLQTGAVIWKTAVPAPGAAVPLGAVIEYYDLVAEKDSAMPLLLLRPSDGGIEARIPLPAGSAVYQDPAGGFFVLKSGEELVAYDAAGHVRWQMAKPDPPNPAFHNDFFALFSGERFALFERENGRPLGELSGSISAQPGSSLRNGILLFQFARGGSKAGQAILARVKDPRR